MPYYEADARVMSGLRQEIEGYGMPLIMFRKFNALVTVIENQIEDEYGHMEVVEILFDALKKHTELTPMPEQTRQEILSLISVCHEMIKQRLRKRAHEKKSMR